MNRFQPPAKFNIFLSHADNMSEMKKHVCFNESVQVEHIETVNDLTPEEIHACWHTNLFFSRQRQMRRRLTAKMASYTDEDIFDMHGLDSRGRMLMRQITSDEGRFIVILEQTEQWEMSDALDPELLAQAYSEVTSKSATEARKRALRIEQQIFFPRKLRGNACTASFVNQSQTKEWSRWSSI
jgi:hypothetical protein